MSASASASTAASVLESLNVDLDHSEPVIEVFYSCFMESKSVQNQGSCDALSEKFKLFGALVAEKAGFAGTYEELQALLISCDAVFKSIQEHLLNKAATKAYVKTPMSFRTDGKAKQKSTTKCAVETCESIIVLNPDGLGYCCAAHKSMEALVPEETKKLFDAKHTAAVQDSTQIRFTLTPQPHQKKQRKTKSTPPLIVQESETEGMEVKDFTSDQHKQAKVAASVAASASASVAASNKTPKGTPKVAASQAAAAPKVAAAPKAAATPKVSASQAASAPKEMNAPGISSPE